jgi:hypothetical protein
MNLVDLKPPEPCARVPRAIGYMARPLSYDELVRQSPQGSIFAHRWWLEAVAPGQVEILEIRRGGAILAAWPVVSRCIDNVREFGMPSLSQKLGILFAPSTAKPVELQSANQRLAGKLIDRLGPFNTFHQNFHENFTDWLPFHWRGYEQSTRYTYVLDDITDGDALWRGLRPHHRKGIRKAQKLGLRVVDDLPLEQFLELNRKTFSRQRLSPLATDDQVRRLDAALCANAGRRIFAGIDTQGRVHAAVYVAWADGTAYYLMGGSEPDLRDSGAQLLAMWDAICFAGRVAKRFDFEGSMLPRIERWFRGFGATQCPYFSITKSAPRPNTLGGLIRQSVAFRWNLARSKLKGNNG